MLTCTRGVGPRAVAEVSTRRAPGAVRLGTAPHLGWQERAAGSYYLLPCAADRARGGGGGGRAYHLADLPAAPRVLGEDDRGRLLLAPYAGGQLMRLSYHPTTWESTALHFELAALSTNAAHLCWSEPASRRAQGHLYVARWHGQQAHRESRRSLALQPGDIPRSLAVSDAGRAAVAWIDGPSPRLQYWSTDQMTSWAVAVPERLDDPGGLVLSPDGRQMAALLEDGVVVWQIPSAVKPPREVDGMSGSFVGLAIDEDNQILLAASDGSILRKQPGGRLQTAQVGSGLRAVGARFSTNGTYVAWLDADGSVWPQRTGGAPPRGIRVAGAGFRPDGMFISRSGRCVAAAASCMVVDAVDGPRWRALGA